MMEKNSANQDRESTLLESYKKTHNQQVLGELYQPYLPLIYGLCLKYFKNTTDAEDAVMDIYLTLGKKLKTHDVQNFKSWLYVVAKNHCLDQLRSRNSKIPKEKEAQLMYSGEIFHPDTELDENRVKQLENCVDELPEEQKLCIDMFYFQKIPYKKITEMTSFSWSQVRSYIQNGRRNLKNCMERS